MARPGTIKDFGGELRHLGPRGFVRRHPMPVLAWVGLVGGLDTTSRGRRPTTRIEQHALEAALEVVHFAGSAWVIRKDRDGPRGPAITAGRGPDNDLVVPDYSVSTLHCHFRVHAESWNTETPVRLYVTDRGSLNGTAVRGARIPEALEVEVFPDDELAMGRFRFLVLSPQGFAERVAESIGMPLN